jgi:stage V sporulation protein G
MTIPGQKVTRTITASASEAKAGREECAVVTCTVRNARPVTSKTLFALVDVEVLIDEVAFVICGIQARREPDGRTAVALPTYRAADGTWLPAIQLPPDLRKPIADAVLAHLVDEGIAKQRF